MWEVLDAKRVGRKGMNEMLNDANIKELVKSSALFEIEL